MNLSIDTVEVEEGPAYGGAILAAVADGRYESVEEACKAIVKRKDTTEPEADLVDKYEKNYQRYRKLYPMLKEFYE